jgi:hypothetical protein
MTTTFPTRYAYIDKARALCGERVDRLGAYLLRGDPLADAVVDAIDGQEDAWKLFENAAALGIAKVKDAPREMRDFFEAVETIPVWVDDGAIAHGGDVLVRSGPLGGLVLGAKALPLAYASPGGNKPLVFSGRLAENAPRRLNETARFVQAVSRRGGVARFAEGYQITLKVRVMHARVRKMILASGRWDETAWGVPVNQHDMVATMILFSGVVLSGLRELGALITNDEADRYLHLWRYVAHLIGVDRDLVPTSERDAHKIADVIKNTQAPPDEDSRALIRALLESPLRDAAREGKTPRDRAQAKRQVLISSLFCRAFVGDELADDLGVAKARWRSLLFLLRRAVNAFEIARTAVPGGDAYALAQGERYWDRVVDSGRAGAALDFPLPQFLAGRMVQSPAA